MSKFLVFITVLFISTVAKGDLNLELPDMNLPSLEVKTGIASSSFSERQAGLKILRKLRGGGSIIEDPELNTWIRSIGHRLTSRASQQSNPFYFIISRDRSVNAFATLGSVIVINAGLILRTKTESELAAVMAHEVAHVTQRHIPRMIKKAEGNKLASSAVILAGILASSKDSQAGQAILNISLATMAHKQLAFSRQAEKEADRVGLRILSSAGFNPNAMPSFLEKLELFGDDENADIREFLQNHPLTLKRISDTRMRAKRLAFYKGKPSTNYLYMQEKIRVLVGSNIATPNKTPAKVKKYTSALQLEKKRNYQQALKTIGSKSKIIPEVVLIGGLLNKLHQYKEATRLLEPLLKLYLGNEKLSLLAAQAYISTGQNKKAWEALNEVEETEQTSLNYFEKRQRVARLLGNKAEAYRSAAEKNIRMGNYKSAVSLLRQALKSPSANTSQLLQIQARLEQMNIYTNR